MQASLFVLASHSTSDSGGGGSKSCSSELFVTSVCKMLVVHCESLGDICKITHLISPASGVQKLRL